MLRLLLENHAMVNFYGGKSQLDSVNDYTCDEPLRLAIKNSHFECAEMLLKVGSLGRITTHVQYPSTVVRTKN